MIECNLEENKANCPCSKNDCIRFGKCCECIEHHRTRNQLPACYFPPEVEKTLERSIEKFVSLHS